MINFGNRQKLQCFYIWVSVLLFATGFSQDLNFRNKGDELRLPSYECYNVEQDYKGYIWISTDNGLCRYDGKSTIIFNKKSGLPDNGIYFLKNNPQTGLRLISANSAILSETTSGFAPEKYSDILRQYIHRDSHRAYLVSETDAGDVINTYNGTYLANRKTGTVRLLSKRESPYYLTVHCDGEQSYFIRHIDDSFPKLKDGSIGIQLQIISGKTHKYVTVTFDQKAEIDRRIKIAHINGSVFLSIENRLISIDKELDVKIYDYPSKILSLYPDPNKGLWVGLFQKGVYYYEKPESMAVARHSLKDYSVSGTLIDREGGVWCSTLEKNVFYAHDVHSVCYNNVPGLNKVATMLKTVNDAVFISTSYDNLYKIPANGSIARFDTNPQNQDYTDIHLFRNNWYLSSKAATIIADDNLAGKKIVGKDFHFTAYTMDSFSDRLFAADYTQLFEIKKDSAIRIADLNSGRIRTLANTSDDEIYIGDNIGLSKFSISAQKRIAIVGISSPVTKILRAKNGILWIASNGEGLHTLENGILKKIMFGDRHNILFDLAEDRSGTIWGSTENGLVSITPGKSSYQTRRYGVENGLLANDIGRIAINGNKLYVSTIEGLSEVSVDHMVNTTPPMIYLRSISVNQQILGEVPKKLILPHDRNSVSFLFDVLTFKGRNNPILRYRLGNDSVYKESVDNEIRFDNLQPDRYRLTVQALNNDGVASAKMIQISFLIKKPFWKETWFLAISMLVFALAAYLLFKKIVNNIRAKETEKTRISMLIAQSQLSALQAQMNPHFIFNAISSIQNYILKNDEKAAYNYLAKFGKLIRMVLNNSRESTLALAQELETLQLYVQLEQLRFKDSFRFELLVDEAIDTFSTYLPAMLIQPYVENAIWHGLMNLDSRLGVLKITISQERSLLKIVIEDNGIGRLQSGENKKDVLHHSIGMQLTEQRLNTIFKLKEFEGIVVEIIDLTDHNGNATGTKVVLNLPNINHV